MKVVIDANWKRYTNTVPKNFEAVGTITDDDGDSGALVVINRGSIPMYWQLNAGVLKGLPQHEVKAAVELAKSAFFLERFDKKQLVEFAAALSVPFGMDTTNDQLRDRVMDVLPTALERAVAKPSESSSDSSDNDKAGL